MSIMVELVTGLLTWWRIDGPANPWKHPVSLAWTGLEGGPSKPAGIDVPAISRHHARAW
jgi:hypothetical protein